MAKIKLDEKIDQEKPDRFARLEKIAGEIRKCQICKKDKSGLAVPGEGDPGAKIVFLGEAPGKQEAKTGRPFIGRSGQLLRTLIQSIGLEEEGVYITSPVKYLPDYITPTYADIVHGRLHLYKQLNVIEPEIIVLLGATAATAMLDLRLQVMKEHGRVVEKDGRNYFLTVHPAAALRSTTSKKILEQDFKKLKKLI